MSLIEHVNYYYTFQKREHNVTSTLYIGHTFTRLQFLLIGSWVLVHILGSTSQLFQEFTHCGGGGGKLDSPCEKVAGEWAWKQGCNYI